MKWGFLIFITGVTACTSASGVLGNDPPPVEESRLPDAAPPPESGLDAAPEAAPDLDAGPCVDCEYFPETCSPDALCPNGPFDPNSPNGSLDSRTSVNAIRGRSVSDVWAAGALGALAHFDGVSWTRSDPGGRQTLRALWLTASTELAFVLPQFLFARGVGVEDGGAGPSDGGWTSHVPVYRTGQAAFTSPIVAVWGDPSNEWLWVGLNGKFSTGANGGLWRLRQSSPSTFEGRTGIATSVCSTFGCSQISGIHGWSVDTLWAVGPSGATVLVTNATADTPTIKAFNSQTKNDLGGVWAASATDAWSVGARGTIRHYTGDPGLWDIVSDVPTDADLNAIWGFSSSDIWAVGNAGVVLHYDGNAWSRVKVAGLGVDRPDLKTVWGASTGHIWIGGEGVILSLGGQP